MLDLIGLAASYAAGFYMNYTVANAVARVKQTEGQGVAADADSAFISSGIGAFLGLKATSISHNFNYLDPQKTQPANGTTPAITAVPAQIQVTTILSVKPFVNVPFLAAVPGLNAPVRFNYFTEIPREETE